jgi:tetratricopeptide (TPR) repeat protein
MKSLIFKILLLVFSLMYTHIYALDVQQIFQRANDNYQAGNFRLAQQDYETILSDTKIFSKELFFNLGNCYYRQNQIGRAVLNYERALRLDPTDKDIVHNIYIMRGKLSDDFEAPNEVFFVRWGRSFRALFSADAWAMFAVFWLWIATVGFSVWLLNKERLWKKRGFILGCIALPLSILLFLSAWSASRVAASTFGIVLAKETAMRVAPDANATASQVLHEGLKIKILEKVGVMVRIKIPNGEEGWLDGKAVEGI